MKITTLSAAPQRDRPAMQFFHSDGLRLAFFDEGPRDGEPIVLVHGFGSNARVNWVGTGWVDLLVGDGRRVVALDNRGHGASDAPHDPALYHTGDMMAEDVRRLMDHLGIDRADLMGFSKGAWIGGHMALRHPERLRSVIFGGLAMAMVEGLGGQETIASALEAKTDAEVKTAKGMAYRAFGKQTGSDLLALAACMRGSRQPVPREGLAALDLPVLVVVGDKDDVAGSVEDFVALVPGAQAVILPGRNHMSSVGDKGFKQAALDFLSTRP